MIRVFSVLILLIVLSPNVVFAEAYLCVADLIGGFSFDEQRKIWTLTKFSDQSKYVVTLVPDSRKWEVKEIGESVARAWCEKGFGELGSLVCQGGAFEFRMNKDNLRFLAAFLNGYWTDNSTGHHAGLFEEGRNTPHIQIGKCGPL